MNIQQFYRQSAIISLNGSIAAFVPVIFLLIGGLFISVRLPILLGTIPFLAYSFVCYQSYLIYQHRYEESKIAADAFPRSRFDLFGADDVLIAFLPAPSLRMLIFEPNGFLIGEIRDMYFWRWRWFLPYFADKLVPRSYGLYDKENQLVAVYKITASRKSKIEIYNPHQEILGFYHDRGSYAFGKSKGELVQIAGQRTIKAEVSSMYTDISLQDKQGLPIGHLKKGWMPLEWGKHFKDGNTPILSFDHRVTEVEKILIFGLLTKVFQYRSH